MCNETPEERQANELIVLKSIYGESVVEIDDDEGCWVEQEAAEGVWRPLRVMLSLVPLHDSAGAHCSLTLHFQCCPQYPDKPPKISVQGVQGLSLENVNNLLKELEQLADRLCGEVMIYQLAHHTQQFLHNHNKPTLSFYEQMVKEKAESEETRQRDILVKQDEEARQIRAELLKRQETLREEPVADDAAGSERALRLLCYEERQDAAWGGAGERGATRGECTCAGRGLRPVRFTAANTKMYLGNCLGHSRLGSAHMALDERGVPALVRRWQLATARDVRRREQRLAALQRDVAALRALQCPALEPYRVLHLHTAGARQHLYAARPYLAGTSLRRYVAAARLYLGGGDLLQLVRRVALALFSALAALHAAHLLHRDVRAENVYLEHDGTVKLVGAGVDARVAELVQDDDSCERHGRAHDVLCAGGVLLALLREGAVPAEESPAQLPAHLPADARDFLSRCVSHDEQSLWPAARLAAHAFLQPERPARAPPVAPEEEGSGERLGALGWLNGDSSRLSADFEVLSWIGEGGFGDVVKVRNRLDCGVYAIKRIKLNPEDVALNRKITREVTLLSRLNHENVVRYYNAWVERGGAGGGARAAPSVEWSLSDAARPLAASSDTDDDVEDDDDPDPWAVSAEEYSSGIVFEGGDDTGSRDHPKRQSSEAAGELRQVLYIQMEFCEKSTLRQAIDRGLHEEPVRAWRLFREVLEGLAHVHSKGMIHRDLKPANIFLDCNDNVKIGDFGLATKIISRVSPEDRSKTQEEGDGALTGEVGTALYVAPELRAGGAAGYNQKADVYSLGVTLFEMFHGPFATGAERVAVLARLRSPEVLLPDYFDTADNAKQVFLLRWMLKANASERPSCAQLAASGHVPRAVPQGALDALLAHALAERGSAAHTRLVRACIAQRATPADLLLFHAAPRKLEPPPRALLTHLTDALVNVFRSHGAEEMTPPLLSLQADAWETRADAVRLMTSAGAVCVLPYDLRLPFARAVALGGARRLRRYAVGRVFRERSERGFHPREALECAFDIVAPRTDGLWADAEALVCASRCAQAMGLRVARLRLGHAGLLSALLHCAGLPEERAPPLAAALRDFALGRLQRLQLQTHLATLALGPKRSTMLMRLADAELQLHELPDLIAQVQQDKWSEALQGAARELAEVAGRARSLGCEMAMTVVPLLAYGAEQHSGVFWQLVAGEPAQRLRERHVVAAGGRYDELVRQQGRGARAAGRVRSPPGAVGFSLSLERAAALLAAAAPQYPCALPVLVCAGEGGGAELAREAWARGLRCELWELDRGAARAALPAGLLLQALGSTVRLDSWEGTRVREMVLAPGEALEVVRQRQQQARAPDGAAGGDGASPAPPPPAAPLVLVSFLTGDEKLNKNYKRQIENQVAAGVGARVAAAAGARRVAVLALAADAARVAALAARSPAPPLPDALPALLHAFADTFGKRPDILEETQAELTKLLRPSGARDETPLLALYSIPDGTCRLLL